MKRNTLKLIHACVLTLVGCLLQVHHVMAKEPLKVAVLAFRGEDKAMARWGATMDYLESSIPGHRFIAVPMDLPALDKAVEAGSVDFVITNAGQYVRVGTKTGVSWLATLKSRRHQGRERVIGSALVVRADSPYYQLDDLRGATLGAVDPLAFGGFQIYWGEMVERGYDPRSHFDQIRFSGFPVDALAFWVRDRLVESAVLPVCLLESLDDEGVLQKDDFRVIEPKPLTGFDCQVSTELYPNWSFAKLKQTPSDLAERVAQALLLMPMDSKAAKAAGALGWTAPVSSYEIHKLYQRLNIHPLQRPWWTELGGWLLRNWLWAALALVIVLTGFLHHLWVQLLVKRRTQELVQMDTTLHQQQLQLEHAQRVAILGELATDLAHELNQPLAAINSYAEGGIVRIRPDQDRHDLIALLERISTQARRGAGIIERIRCFARKESFKREPVAFPQLVRDTLGLLEYELMKAGVSPEIIQHGELPTLQADPVEVQQLVVNLVRNSIEAISESTRTRRLRITLESTVGDSGINLRVEDSGIGFGAENRDTLLRPFFTTKKNGLGLGLAICRRIVEAHGGTIEFAASELGGAQVRCTLSGETN